jgi:hypothetical protein
VPQSGISSRYNDSLLLIRAIMDKSCCSASTWNSLKNWVMDPQVLEVALLITRSTESNSDKSTPCSPYLIFHYRNTTLHWDHLTCLIAWKNKMLLTSGSATTKYIYLDQHYNSNFSKQIYTITIILLNRSTLNYVILFTKQIYTKTMYLLSRSTLKLYIY